MRYRLRTYDYVPSGGFPYRQVKGIEHDFPSQPSIEAQAQIVSAFRKNNGLPRSSFAETLVDIDRQTCARLSNSTQWCVEETDNAEAIAIGQSSPLVNPCPGCGAK